MLRECLVSKGEEGYLLPSKSKNLRIEGGESQKAPVADQGSETLAQLFGNPRIGTCRTPSRTGTICLS
eukprot:6207225-Amphidinium_carterae.2